MSSGDNSGVGSSPIDLRRRVSNQVLKLHQSFRQSFAAVDRPNPKSVEEIITKLFDMGGIVSGGSVIGLIHNKPIKDLDFYFNDEQAYLDALELTYGNSRFDICWYFEQPHELHDIGYVMCNLHPDGRLEITEPARQAMITNVSSLFIEHIIWPERTADRLLKYNHNYGLKYNIAEILAFVAINKIDRAPALLDISV